MIGNYFLPYDRLLFILLMVSFVVQKLFTLTGFLLFICVLLLPLLLLLSLLLMPRNHHQDLCQGTYCLYFPLGVLWFQFSKNWNHKSLIHFLKLFLFFKLKYSWFLMLCQFLLHSKMIQLDVHTCIVFFSIFFFYGLSKSIEYSSLCHTVGPCRLPILCIIVCIC